MEVWEFEGLISTFKDIIADVCTVPEIGKWGSGDEVGNVWRFLSFHKKQFGGREFERKKST